LSSRSLLLAILAVVALLAPASASVAPPNGVAAQRIVREAGCPVLTIRDRTSG